MILAIEQDARRFRQIVRGQIKRNLRRYVTNGELIGRQGKDLVSIPLPEIELPHFRFGEPMGGVGQGEGEAGAPVGVPEQGEGGTGAGDRPGYHLLEVELTLDELAELMGEALELPRIEPRGRRNVEEDVLRYSGMRRVGPESLRVFKRTYREALKRQLASGIYDPERPRIVPVHDDKRYRSWKTIRRPESNAVVIYMMDVSGSMTPRKKELVRLTAFWIDTWLRAHYQNLACRYLVHDAAAHEVDSDTFYRLRESGGTRISSAYELCQRILQKDYPAGEWNVYAFHFSDGENYDTADDRRSLELVESALLPAINLFGYGQVSGAPGHQFLDIVSRIESEHLSTARINTDEDILPAIKAFLGKGL